MASAVIKPTHLVILVLALLVNLYDEGVGGTSFTLLDLDQQLKILNKPFVKSFKMGDADIFDCVDIYKQPALSHPLLKDHKIQMKPTSVPVMGDGKSAYKVNDEEFGTETQRCPNGTVPIRRSSKQDLIKSQALMKAFTERNRISNKKQYRHELAFPSQEGSYCGVYGEINLQNPQVEYAEQFSEALMRLTSGEGNQFNSVQAGWMVYKALFGDNRTRLVTSWTADGGISTGCYNTLCPGFVQVHPSLAPGYVFPQTSTYGGQQWQAKFLIVQDRDTGNWWLVVGSTNERIGYWPRAIFTGLHLQSCGERVGWGGQVFKEEKNTSPPMGSGHFAKEGFQKAADIHNLQYVNEKFDHIQIGWDQLLHSTMSPECYTLSQYSSHGIFYGGPGGDCYS